MDTGLCIIVLEEEHNRTLCTTAQGRFLLTQEQADILYKEFMSYNPDGNYKVYGLCEGEPTCKEDL